MPETPQTQWSVVYRDGTILNQFDADAPEGRSFHDIDQKEKAVSKFVIGIGKKPLLIIDVPEGWRLIYRARHFMKVDGSHTQVWLAGAQAKDRSGQQFLSILYEDGRVVTTHKFRDDIRELASPELATDRGEEWDF